MEKKREEALKELGLNEYNEVDEEMIKHAYRVICKMVHPDLAKDESDVEAYIRVTKAKDYLLYGKTDEDNIDKNSVAMQQVCVKFIEVISNNSFDIDGTNIFGILNENINKEKKALEMTIDEIERTIRKLGKIKEKVIYKKKNGNDIIQTILKQRIEELEAEIINRENQYKIKDVMLKIIDDYEYRFGEKRFNEMFTPTSFSFYNSMS